MRGVALGDRTAAVPEFEVCPRLLPSGSVEFDANRTSWSGSGLAGLKVNAAVGLPLTVTALVTASVLSSSSLLVTVSVTLNAPRTKVWVGSLPPVDRAVAVESHAYAVIVVSAGVVEVDVTSRGCLPGLGRHGEVGGRRGKGGRRGAQKERHERGQRAGASAGEFRQGCECPGGLCSPGGVAETHR